MKPQFKIDFETFMIANQTKYDMYFEGETYKNEHDHMFIKFIPISTTRPAINCEQNYVIVRFYIFSDNLLNCDKIQEDLSKLLSEKNINGMEFGVLETFGRGNKHGKTWENIANIKFYHWGTPAARIDKLI